MLFAWKSRKIRINKRCVYDTKANKSNNANKHVLSLITSNKHRKAGLKRAQILHQYPPRIACAVIIKQGLSVQLLE